MFVKILEYVNGVVKKEDECISIYECNKVFIRDYENDKGERTLGDSKFIELQRIEGGCGSKPITTELIASFNCKLFIMNNKGETIDRIEL